MKKLTKTFYQILQLSLFASLLLSVGIASASGSIEYKVGKHSLAVNEFGYSVDSANLQQWKQDFGANLLFMGISQKRSAHIVQTLSGLCVEVIYVDSQFQLFGTASLKSINQVQFCPDRISYREVQDMRLLGMGPTAADPFTILNAKNLTTVQADTVFYTLDASPFQ
jgi:hypothetical protein